jgi:hypothetical protein
MIFTFLGKYFIGMFLGYASAFEKYNDTDVNTQMTSYDYGSVMHYGSTAFAINSSAPTIIAVLNPNAVLGQRVGLSPIDILEIQRYYGCVPTPNATTTIASQTTIKSAGHFLQHVLHFPCVIVLIFSMLIILQ